MFIGRFVLGVACSAVALTCVACGGSSSNTVAPTPSADVTVSIQGQRGDQSYAPNPITIRVGQTLAWHNVDSAPHTATADTVGFNTGVLSAGVTSSPMTMATAGTFAYHCTIHPNMSGTLIVQ